MTAGNRNFTARFATREIAPALWPMPMRPSLSLRSLVRSWWNISRRAPLLPVASDAHAVVAEIASMAARTLPAGITVEIESPAHRMPLMVDADRLNAALLNLVINARDAIGERPRGCGRIRIAVTPVQGGATGDAPDSLGPGEYLRFSVIDDGPGMTDEQAARAFDAFYTTKEIGKGSGLGLASAKGFAEQSGGTMTLSVSRPVALVVSLYLADRTALDLARRIAPARTPPAADLLPTRSRACCGQFHTSTTRSLRMTATRSSPA